MKLPLLCNGHSDVARSTVGPGRTRRALDRNGRPGCPIACLEGGEALHIDKAIFDRRVTGWQACFISNIKGITASAGLGCLGCGGVDGGLFGGDFL